MEKSSVRTVHIRWLFMFERIFNCNFKIACMSSCLWLLLQMLHEFTKLRDWHKLNWWRIARKEAKSHCWRIIIQLKNLQKVYVYITYNVCLHLQDQTVIFCMSFATSLTTQRGKQKQNISLRFQVCFFLHVIIIIYNFNLNHIMCMFLNRVSILTLMLFYMT